MNKVVEFLRFGFREKPRTDLELAIRDTEARISECRDALELPKLHPMTRYFTRLHLARAEAKLRELQHRHLTERREAEAARRGRSLGRLLAGHPRDPYAPLEARQQREPKPAPVGVQPPTPSHW